MKHCLNHCLNLNLTFKSVIKHIKIMELVIIESHVLKFLFSYCPTR